jgi:hypothetical protein
MRDLSSILNEAKGKKFVIFGEVHNDEGKNEVIKQVSPMHSIYVEAYRAGKDIPPAYVSLTKQFNVMPLYTEGNELNVKAWAENIVKHPYSAALVGSMHMLFDRRINGSKSEYAKELSNYNLPIQMEKLGTSREDILTVDLEPSSIVSKPVVVEPTVKNSYLSFLAKEGADAVIIYPSALDKEEVKMNNKSLKLLIKEMQSIFRPQFYKICITANRK